LTERLPTTAIRIRFSGSRDTDTIHLIATECQRFLNDWKSYLNGLGARGGEYTTQDGEQSGRISLNFTQIAYTEPATQS
jgi:hypothetical protein